MRGFTVLMTVSITIVKTVALVCMASNISRVTALRSILETLTGDQQETFDEKCYN